MQPHPYAHLRAVGPRVGRQRGLPVDRGGDRALRARERHEERIASGVDLMAAVRVERGAQQSPVVGQDLAVAVS